VSYPLWSYFPRNIRPPEWGEQFVAAVAGAESTISTVSERTGLSSDDVLRALTDDLVDLGYAVETGKRAAQKIKRPVLFGEGGVPAVSYEIDAFHDGLGIAVEVEAGRGAANNADFRDIVRTSLILDAQYLALLMPVTYRAGHQTWNAYASTRGQFDAIYASNRLRLPFTGVLLIGY
jgi:hypothetical protein